MRQLLGLITLLYGLLLALNTTAPTLAKLAGDRVIATLGQGCSADLGSPPFGGLYGNCPAALPGLDEGGRVFGARVADHAGGTAEVYRYPLLDSFAVHSPSNTDQVLGIIAVLIIVLGILLLVTDRRRAPDDSAESAESAESGGDASDSAITSDT